MSSPQTSAGTSRFARLFGRGSGKPQDEKTSSDGKVSTWSMGVLNDKETVQVPGSVLLLAANRNEPLGLRNVHARTSHSSIPTGFHVQEPPLTPGGSRREPEPPTTSSRDSTAVPPAPSPAPDDAGDKKTTKDGQVILEPQPDDSANDPLNWPSWRRDTALLSLGFYCMVGGGITPIIAAGFTDVGEEFDVDTETVALTTGLYMMGMGLGSVIASPTAILYGKRPVYLVSAIIFIGTSLWCAWSPSFESLLAARVFQGMAVSPVECLPSATIAEIFFLHERAFRIGIYTLLLLGGKNLVPLVSAAVIGAFGWRWVFWIVAMIVALCFALLFLFVPETFWDRTPTRRPSKRPSFLRRISSRHGASQSRVPTLASPSAAPGDGLESPRSPGAASRNPSRHVGFAASPEDAERSVGLYPDIQADPETIVVDSGAGGSKSGQEISSPSPAVLDDRARSERTLSISSQAPGTPRERHVVYQSADNSQLNVSGFSPASGVGPEKIPDSAFRGPPKAKAYTHNLRQQPPQPFLKQLKVWNGRLNNDKWLKVMCRPFILFCYPAVLWSAAVYACSVGWLIVVSETLAILYRNPELYGFDAMQTGLVYLSPFIGGILGTGVAGKVSDIIVKKMAARNGGLYEPEFRLVMAIPITITTCIGLMGFGWSAEKGDPWIVPTTFFGIISFGCSLGSTTSITFCVDSYRQYAGEALVTLNFAKNIFHGLVFSLFVTHWLADEGAKMVFLWIGIIQLILMLFTIPMYIYGKRARMWTVRKNLMEKF